MLRGRVVLGGFEDAEHGAGELRAHVLQACLGLLLGLKGADGEEGLGGPDAGSEDGRKKSVVEPDPFAAGTAILYLSKLSGPAR